MKSSNYIPYVQRSTFLQFCNSRDDATQSLYMIMALAVAFVSVIAILDPLQSLTLHPKHRNSVSL